MIAKFCRHFFIASFLLISLSCKPLGPDSINKEFEKNFSKEVGKIRAQRAQNEKTYEKQDLRNSRIDNYSGKNYQNFDDPAKILNVSSPLRDSQASVDTSAFELEEIRYFSPDATTFQRGSAGFEQNRIPDDIFDLHYNTRQHPPFALRGVEFDGIRIPERDAYGVSSNLNDKQYRLAGNDSYQRSIDGILSSQKPEDLEFSEILIKEQKEIYRQARIDKLLGNDVIKKEEVKEDDSWMKERAERRNDPVQKIIADQVIQYNLARNRPPPEDEKNKKKK